MHLGKSETVPDRDVVGIFDIEKATESEHTKEFLKTMEKGYRSVNLASDLPLSFVVTDDPYTDRVYISSFSVKTLIKRTKGYE